MQGKTSNGQGWPPSRVAWYGVVILVLAFIFSFIDRIIIALLVEPIKADLSLTDTDLGWLQGLAFAIFYAAFGLPIGRLADRYSRRWIIGIGIFLWSLATAACGLARSYAQLFLARVGVGVGEAALSPAAYSMIADYFPPQKLGRALGVYQSGAFFGAGIAFLVGGLVIQFAVGAEQVVLPLVGEVRPWQMVFVAVGLPGVLVALLMLTVVEPPRRGKLAGQDEMSLGAVMSFAGKRWRVFLGHFIGFALLAVPITTILTWVPTYFIRSFGYTPPQTGLTLGAILLVLSPAGVYTGGWLADFWQTRGRSDATLRVGLLTATLLLPISFFATQASSATMALLLFGPFVFCASLAIAAAPAALQIVVPNQMRAQVSAAWMLVLNIVTAGIGPTAVGFVTDNVFGDPAAVGRSIALVNCLSVPVAALALFSALRPFREAAASRAEQVES